MKSKLVFVNYAVLDGSSLSTDASLVGDYEVSNLASPIADATWKSPDGDTSVNITLTLDHSRVIGFFGIFDHNLSVTATIDYQLYLEGVALEGGSGSVEAHEPIYSPYELLPFLGRPYGYPDGTETDALWYLTAHFIDNPMVADEIRLTISDTGNADNQIRAAYLMVGEEFQTQRSFMYGSSVSAQLNPQMVHQPNGSVFVKYDTPKSEANIIYNGLSKFEAGAFNRNIRFVQQKNLPVFASYFENEGGTIHKQHQILFYPTSVDSPIRNQADKYDAKITGIEAVNND